MAHIVGLVVSADETFRKQIGRLLRSGAVPVSVVDERGLKEGVPPDVVIVDTRTDTPSALATIERLRAEASGIAIFAVAVTADPDLILQTMRAGANEFFLWPPAEEMFHGAVRRTAARREASQGTKPAASTLVFFGAKGGAGTTTIAVNCGVELARIGKRSTIIVDLKAGLGEVALFLGIRPRYSVLDAIDNLHRLDREFLKELVSKHKSGLEILAGSDHFDRPGASDGTAIEELFRLLTRQYEYVIVDAGSQINSCTVAALYTADQMFLVGNPDVPSVRNAQRLLERVRELGACGERARFILNRAAEPYPIPPKQIETALGHPIHHTFPSDYKTVSAALNSGVPLTLAGNSELASQFDLFTRRILDPAAMPAASPAGAKRSLLGFDKIASIW
ncbi:MAG TPA: AAA family ATPase [Vicinamibacterales bacterium]|jgi:pilus assembly protein CpaE|nr:AAA family ATPase [Vicinamibacterales bacterium]